MPVEKPPSGGSEGVGTGVSTGGSPTGGTKPIRKVNLQPPQICGFVPLFNCDATECREIDIGCCFRLKVFGDKTAIATNKSTYENDMNTFVLSFNLYTGSPTATASWRIEKCIDNEWVQQTAITSSAYGPYYALGSIPSHKTYTIFTVNWGRVVNTFGPGCYRIKVLTFNRQVQKNCKVSYPFFLQEWDCNRAHGTVKFEAWNTGKIGNIEKDYIIFDLCGVTLFDSIRLPGYFGEEKTGYAEIVQEFQTGKQKLIRDEATQKFRYESGLLPKWAHDRFKVYGMMADELRVSDYNRNNADYDIKRKHIIKASGYEPKYFDEDWQRLHKVEDVIFAEGVQSVIKSICCTTIQGAAS